MKSIPIPSYHILSSLIAQLGAAIWWGAFEVTS